MDTVQMTRAEIEARTGRFAKLPPMEFLKDDTVVSQAAEDIVLARTLMPVVLEFSRDDDGGEKVVLSRGDTFSCPPGVHRGFRNDVKDSVLLTIITGGINDRARHE